MTEECDLSVLDFGLARTISTNTEEVLTAYVVSRWYRAPEVERVVDIEASNSQYSGHFLEQCFLYVRGRRLVGMRENGQVGVL